MVLALKGLDNPSCVLLRQSIELALKHVYFLTHPTEHAWATTREGYRALTFQHLIEYVRKTDEYRQAISDDLLGCKLADWYGRLSRHVHVQNKGVMKYSAEGRRIVGTLDDLKLLDQRSKNVWPLLMQLLVIFQRDKILRASDIEKRLIRQGLPRGHGLL